MFVLIGTVLSLLCAHATAYAITGISAGVDSNTGARPLRQEINTFAKQGSAWDLFVLSLLQLQQANQNDTLSYFQIAGIHGFPRIPWDGVAGNQSYPGFCTHAAVPFPTWHRPYVALIEQVLWSNAQLIAQSYPPNLRNEYIAAAQTLRFPFWDWATNPTLPEVVSTQNITVNTPDGIQTINNPLFNYTFQGNAAGNGFPTGHPMANYPWTVRHFSNILNSSNISDANAQLLANAPTILSLTYQLLATPSNYTAFACTLAPGGQGNPSNNIENIHNGIHNFVGGQGHMTYPEVAAFDPIFWLHHANVDRLLAIWQVLNPDTWVEPVANVYGTYYEAIGFVDSASSALAPFHSDNQSTFWTSDMARRTRTFGYTYPELIDWNTNVTDFFGQVRSEVNTLYNPAINRNSTSALISSRTADVTKEFGGVTFELAHNLGVNNLDMQWTIHVQLRRFAYVTTFIIDFFLGDPPESTSAWATAPNLVGSHAQFITSNVSLVYSNGLPDTMLGGQVSLTYMLAAIVARGILPDLTPQFVVPLLAQSLTWRARRPDGCMIDIENLLDLSIAVASRNVQPATSMKQFPVYGRVQHHPEATNGKPGCAKYPHGNGN